MSLTSFTKAIKRLRKGKKKTSSEDADDESLLSPGQEQLTDSESDDSTDTLTAKSKESSKKEKHIAKRAKGDQKDSDTKHTSAMTSATTAAPMTRAKGTIESPPHVVPSGSVQVHVSASRDQDEKKDASMEVKVSGRSSTGLGRLQGDHASAWAAFKACVIGKCEGLPLEAAIKVVVSTIDDYMNDHNHTASTVIQQIIGELAEYPRMNPADIQVVTTALKAGGVSAELTAVTQSCLEFSQRAILERVLEMVLAVHLTLRNRLALTAFPRDGAPPPPRNEGNLIKEGLKELKSEAVKLGHGKRIAPSALVKAAKKFYWYPEVPASMLLTKEQLHSQFPGKYSADTEPRSNDLDLLCQTLENHLQLIFLRHPEFLGRSLVKDFVTMFIEEVIKKDWPTVILKNDKLGKGVDKKQAVMDVVLVNLFEHHRLSEYTLQRSLAVEAEEKQKARAEKEKKKDDEMEHDDDEMEQEEDIQTVLSAPLLSSRSQVDTIFDPKTVAFDKDDKNEYDFPRRDSDSSTGSASGDDVEARSRIDTIPYPGHRVTFQNRLAELQHVKSHAKTKDKDVDSRTRFSASRV